MEASLISLTMFLVQHVGTWRSATTFGPLCSGKGLKDVVFTPGYFFVEMKGGCHAEVSAHKHEPDRWIDGRRGRTPLQNQTSAAIPY